jgi:hypothetical protein
LHKLTAIKNPQAAGYIPVTELWKYYYLLRNEILSLSGYLPNTFSRWRFYVWHIYRAVKNSFKILALDHVRLRLSIEWLALWHGLARLSGKTMDPVAFKKHLAEVTKS